jgi:hypothetical protein
VVCLARAAPCGRQDLVVARTRQRQRSSAKGSAGDALVERTWRQRYRITAVNDLECEGRRRIARVPKERAARLIGTDYDRSVWRSGRCGVPDEDHAV